MSRGIRCSRQGDAVASRSSRCPAQAASPDEQVDGPAEKDVTEGESVVARPHFGRSVERLERVPFHEIDIHDVRHAVEDALHQQGPQFEEARHLDARLHCPCHERRVDDCVSAVRIEERGGVRRVGQRGWRGEA